MLIEKTRIKFMRSDDTGEIIGFVSRNSKKKTLRGVRETSQYRKKICVLSEDLKGQIIPDKLYDVELKAMHSGAGYVVISAELVLFEAEVKLIVIPKAVYQVCICFGNKTIYFDPKDGRSKSSNTFAGVMKVLDSRTDIKDKDKVIKEFKAAAIELIRIMEIDGFYLPLSNKYECHENVAELCM